MQNKLLLSVLLTSAAMPAFSQGRDTVFAVHKLFREKRACGAGLLDAAPQQKAKALYDEQQGHPPTAQESRQAALGNTAFTLAGMAKASRYSVENEAEVLKRYAEGWGLPADIRHRLRRKHFHRTAKDLDLPAGQ
jgi:hypothetical protein